jgi:predicted alpha/beta superfamily hydrolase
MSFPRAILLVLSLNFSVCFGQHVIVISAVPADTPPDDFIYLASDLNNWDPGDENYVFANSDLGLVLELPQGSANLFQGKFTRGSWETVEGNAAGGFLPNRTFNFSDTDTLFADILTWEGFIAPDDLPPNLIVVDEEFGMPELNRTRRVRVLLPLEYDLTDIDYPVLYMHDGQNLFSASESFAGEWEVDEAMVNFENAGYEGCIVVAIDNGGSLRIAEYTPWANPQYGGGEGDEYISFVANTLKPFIDENFRTLPGREHTGIMGSSLGGLISHYAGFAQSGAFSKIGVFSPSFWFTDDIYEYVTSQPAIQGSKFFILAGGQESASLEQDVIDMIDIMESNGFDPGQIHFEYVPNGQHSEWFWAQEFPGAFDWLFLSNPLGTNTIHYSTKPILYPNPVEDVVNVHFNSPQEIKSIYIYDVTGRLMLNLSIGSDTINLSELSAGIYNVVIDTSKGMFSSKLVKK